MSSGRRMWVGATRVNRSSAVISSGLNPVAPPSISRILVPSINTSFDRAARVARQHPFFLSRAQAFGVIHDQHVHRRQAILLLLPPAEKPMDPDALDARLLLKRLRRLICQAHSTEPQSRSLPLRDRLRQRPARLHRVDAARSHSDAFAFAGCALHRRDEAARTEIPRRRAEPARPNIPHAPARFRTALLPQYCSSRIRSYRGARMSRAHSSTPAAPARVRPAAARRCATRFRDFPPTARSRRFERRLQRTSTDRIRPGADQPIAARSEQIFVRE